MDIFRLTRWHVVAVVAALLLLLFSALDWWSTDAGEDLRRSEGLARPEPGESAEQQQFDKDVRSEASAGAEGVERTMWAADGTLDRAVQLLVLAAAATALAVAAVRAAGHRGAALAALAAALAALAALATTVDVVHTGSQPGGQVEVGVVVALIALGALAYAAARAARADEPEGHAGTAEEPRTRVAG